VKVLLYSPAFLPQIGGLELNVAHLAHGLQRRGHQVTVVTRTAGDGADELDYRVVRRPGPLALVRLARWADVYFQANVSLRGLWPLLLVRRPWVVSHHSWYRRVDGRVAWQDHLKRWLLRFAAGSIAVSRAVADDLGTPATVIPNAYRDELFRELPGEPRNGELLFVGRLVSDKGVDVLLAALAALAGEGLRPRLQVVGEGPERPRLAAQSAALGLGDQVSFAGTQTGEALVRTMNRHRVLVVPSRYDEPFGIVALEGIACGCLVVGSRGGGLADAIGDCGITFRNGDATDLARALREALARPAIDDEAGRRRREHLAAHASERVIDRYCEVLTGAIAGGAGAATRGTLEASTR
jgi:glycosyltransferase involved in cell wall biosynthesis